MLNDGRLKDGQRTFAEAICAKQGRIFHILALDVNKPPTTCGPSNVIVSRLIKRDCTKKFGVCSLEAGPKRSHEFLNGESIGTGLGQHMRCLFNPCPKSIWLIARTQLQNNLVGVL